jgi:UDP-N-acetyl-D-galactosamine dehydrogenase
VGGHCIGVDPYYLTYKAEQLGYHPQVVLAGRRINDGMGRWVVEQLVLEMARRGMVLGGSRVLVLGLTFKENCPDLRNTRVVDVVQALVDYGMQPVVVDGWADPVEALHEYGLSIQSSIPVCEQFAAVIGAVAHDAFAQMTLEQWCQPLSENGVLIDLKGVMPRELIPIRL